MNCDRRRYLLAEIRAERHAMRALRDEYGGADEEPITAAEREEIGVVLDRKEAIEDVETVSPETAVVDDGWFRGEL
jgi:hypothetical protein